MEQTLLPDGVSTAETIKKTESKSQSNYLTSKSFRVMNTIVNKKEAENANRKQKSNQGNQANGPVPQTELFLRSSGECGRETSLPLAGRKGVQEPLGSGEGYHRTCLRRLGLLECADRRNRTSRNHSQRTASRTNAGTCSECYQGRPQEDRGLSGPQSEGCAGRPDSLVLPGLRQEFHYLGSRDTGDLSGEASGQIILPEKRIETSRPGSLDRELASFHPDADYQAPD